MLGAPVPAYVHVTFNMTLDKTKTKKKNKALAKKCADVRIGWCIWWCNFFFASPVV